MKEEKEETEKQLNIEKLGKEERLKKLDQQISSCKSEIEKHKDTLGNLQANQDFLLTLSPEDFQLRRE